MQSEIARVPRGTIEYTLRGCGSVVLVCHGTSSDCFSTVVSDPLLDADLRVLVPSRPGYGRTPLKTGASAAAAAHALICLLDSLAIPRCAVLAISGGGPTGVALTAEYPERVSSLILAAAVTRPESRPLEPSYKQQMAFYGPSHNLMWGMLGLMGRLSPRSMARQTLSIFSTHDADDALHGLTHDDVASISRFYQNRSSRAGALNDATHTVGADLLRCVQQPVLVVHSREDRAVPFEHAQWSRQHILHAELCEAGVTGHFFWVGPDAARVGQRMVEFLKSDRPMV
jgi:pimeloyl-ACP methyl ester carboxylesterase